MEVAERAAARAADEQSRQMEQAMAHEQAMAEARESQQQALQRAEAQVQPYEASQYHQKTSKSPSHVLDNLMLYRSKTRGRWCCPVQPIFQAALWCSGMKCCKQAQCGDCTRRAHVRIGILDPCQWQRMRAMWLRSLSEVSNQMAVESISSSRSSASHRHQRENSMGNYGHGMGPGNPAGSMIIQALIA